MEKIYRRNSVNEHHGKDWNPKLLDMSLNTFLDKLKEVDPNSYNRVESIIEKHKGGIVKESNINEHGGYDDPNIRSRHMVGYSDNIKEHYNKIVGSLQGLEKISDEILDDELRNGIEQFLNDVSPLLKTLGRKVIDSDKKNLNDTRGGRPTKKD